MMRLVGRKTWLGLLLAVLSLTGGALGLVRYFHIRHLRVVEPGRIYRSGQPEPQNWHDLIDDMGIRTVINLREGDHPDDRLVEERELLERRHIRYVNIQMDEDSPPTDEQAEQFLAIMRDRSNEPVLIHCKRGKDRTGLMVALYRMRVDGWSYDRAIAEMTDIRDHEPPHPRIRQWLKQHERPSPATRGEGR